MMLFGSPQRDAVANRLGWMGGNKPNCITNVETKRLMVWERQLLLGETFRAELSRARDRCF